MSRQPATLQDGLALSLDQLLARQSFKWRQYQPGVLAACVADMDLGTAPAVQAALAQVLQRVDFTYPLRDGRKADRAVAHAFAARMRRLYGWQAEADQVLVLPDLVQATFAAVMAFTDPGDGVVVQVPHYAPFREAVEGTGRRLIPLEMRAGADGYQLDLERLAHAIDVRTRVLILCNPHNPTGRVLSRAELDSVLAFAERHALIVVSDEIHADLVYPGARHLPFASLSGAAAARTVTLNSAHKSFNIAGLRCAVAHFGTPELQRRFHARLPARLTGAVNNLAWTPPWRPGTRGSHGSTPCWRTCWPCATTRPTSCAASCRPSASTYRRGRICCGSIARRWSWTSRRRTSSSSMRRWRSAPAKSSMRVRRTARASISPRRSRCWPRS